MDELARELATLRENVVPAWSDSRSERLFAGVGQLRRRRRIQRACVYAGVALAACAALYLPFSATPLTLATLPTTERGSAVPSDIYAASQPSAADVVTFPEQAAPAELAPRLPARTPARLADGSQIEVTSASGELAIERNLRDTIDLNLLSGAARFDVIPNARRHFVVAAGSVEVTVVGTAFEVERAPGRVRVTVSHGKVRVHSAGGAGVVEGGESAWFDEAQSAPSEPAMRERSGAGSGKTRGWRTRHALRSTVAGREERNEPRAAWRSLSQSGDYEGAYRLLAEGTAVADDDSAALMDAADAARLSGHPEVSVGYLRKVLDRHRRSPVAPLAAFTLGRVLLERLGQPSEAAEAFATARDLAPRGSLAQDALAREVEAWSKAGHPQEAYERARQYVESYPAGRRLRAVQLYGGLTTP